MATSRFPPTHNTAGGNTGATVSASQSDRARHREEKHVQRLPVITEPSSRVLQTGVNTLQKTLILRTRAELDEVNVELEFKRQQLKSRMETLAKRRFELELKRQQDKETRMRFEKFVAEKDMRQSQALKVLQRENILMQREIEDLTNNLKQLRTRKQFLKERTAKFKVFEDGLKKTFRHFSICDRDKGSEFLFASILRHCDDLLYAKEKLQQRLVYLEVKQEQYQQQLQTMKHEHAVKRAMAIKKLSELQSELQVLEEKNNQEEDNQLMEQEKAVDVAAMLMGIDSLAERCYLPSDGPLENMNILTKMDMVKESFLALAEIERRARSLMQLGCAMTKKATVKIKRWK